MDNADTKELNKDSRLHNLNFNRWQDKSENKDSENEQGHNCTVRLYHEQGIIVRTEVKFFTFNERKKKQTTNKTCFQ